jgi:formate/nitrite transporter FocA (FNT family)
MAVYEKKATFGGLLHNWFWSYLGNFIGRYAFPLGYVLYSAHWPSSRDKSVGELRRGM